MPPTNLLQGTLDLLILKALALTERGGVLPDGRHVKLQIVAYYALANQRVCDETGKVPMPSGAGNMRLRWAFLD